MLRRLLLKLIQHTIDLIEPVVDLLTRFRSRKDYLPAGKYKEHDLRLHHPVYQAGENLRLVSGELCVLRTIQPLQGDGELNVAGADYVLDFEFLELDIVKADLFYHLGVVFGRRD